MIVTNEVVTSVSLLKIYICWIFSTLFIDFIWCGFSFINSAYTAHPLLLSERFYTSIKIL